MEDIYQDFWGAFLEQTGRPETTVMTDVTYFGGRPQWATVFPRIWPQSGVCPGLETIPW